jgi:putative hemolysin
MGVLLSLLACISASEYAFFSLRNLELEQLTKSSESRLRLAADLLKKPRLLLMTMRAMQALVITIIIVLAIAIVNNSVNMIAAMVVAVLLFSLCVMLFGKILPVRFAVKNPSGVIRFFSPVWSFLVIVLKPLTLSWLKINQLTDRGVENRGFKDTVEELNQALEMAAVDHGASEDDKEILRGIVNFGTLSVKQVMRSRSRISAVDITISFEQLIEQINESGYSRFPVYRKSLDKVEGILHVKDLLPFLDKGHAFHWQDFIRPGFFVPGVKRLDSLLKDFQEKHVHMAIVVNEYGGTLGLVTLEDIIEEIISDLNDDFDEEELEYEKPDTNTYIFQGKTSLHDFCKVLGIDMTSLDAVRKESRSLAGLLLELNRELPRSGTQINFEQFTFVVESADRKKIKRVKVIIHDKEKL